ncbi:uncharacterized protein si:dkeyp-114g9.1 [Electrophorus electricus]|uniref:uncharacterized protein si:dkeyp-114g9.1 n=1 Tax=Electrophorus electricus TaxID=8005 RepID=UPI0015CFBE94|nr:uncharacterized protein si:dkeyp-114g9.1 [Electrophorus electricus]
MAHHNTTRESALLEQFSRLYATADEDINTYEQNASLGNGDSSTGLVHLSDEVLILILRQLDPVSLLRLGSTCRLLFRVCSCNSLWTRHFQDSFGVGLPHTAASHTVTAKAAFRLVFMWKALFRNVHCNRSLQAKLFAGTPFPPHEYWAQWLVLEERVPLPSVRLPRGDVEKLWGIPPDLFRERLQETSEECELLKFEWRELYNMALGHHGSVALVFWHVLSQHHGNDHSELESMYHQYTQCRFQWLFTYWLFRQPPPFSRQLRAIYLQWRRYSKKKVTNWGETLCDVRYLASLHPITSDYWRGKLARGDENVGIHTVVNYFSMCKSLVAWILGRDWGRLKRRKVYEDTLEGVYMLLKQEMQETLVEHERFWQAAKVQMSRVCMLEEAAANYVGWKMIGTLPYYKLYLVSGNEVYLEHVRGFLCRKRQIHDWMYLEENTWLRELLPDEIYSLLEFDTKILQGSLHGDSLSAQLSRLLWLYLHSGQLLYLETVKGLVQQIAHTQLGFLTSRALPQGLQGVWV